MIYELADLRIQLHHRYAYTAEHAREYLSADQTSPCHLEIIVTDGEIEAEKNSSPVPVSNGYAENICLYRALCMKLPSLDRLLLHCSVVEYEGGAYAFLGRSGTGKSTHSNLWTKYLPKAKILNGDKPLLRYHGGSFTVYGTPWKGKEGVGYRGSAPLKGLCFLEQAKRNTFTRLTAREAVSRLFLQLLMPSDEQNAEKTLYLADKLLACVPCYLLRCDISKQAVAASFEGMTGEVFHEN